MKEENKKRTEKIIKKLNKTNKKRKRKKRKKKWELKLRTFGKYVKEMQKKSVKDRK